jgi:hypothetical protein
MAVFAAKAAERDLLSPGHTLPPNLGITLSALSTLESQMRGQGPGQHQPYFPVAKSELQGGQGHTDSWHASSAPCMVHAWDPGH